MGDKCPTRATSRKKKSNENAAQPPAAKKNLDEQRLQLIRDTQKIIHSGTLEQLEEILNRTGKGRNTPEGRALIQRFISLRGDLRR
jgi:hypothetical protein